MARKIAVLNEDLTELAKFELQNVAEHKVGMRLQAIVSCSEHPEGLVASVYNVNRSTIWRWIKKFKENGIEGIKDKPKGHRPSILSKDEQAQIKQWLIEDKKKTGEEIHWTLPLLLGEIHNIFNKIIGKTTLWRLVRKMGFRQKVPRPFHAKSDPVAQDNFKKNC